MPVRGIAGKDSKRMGRVLAEAMVMVLPGMVVAATGCWVSHPAAREEDAGTGEGADPAAEDDARTGDAAEAGDMRDDRGAAEVRDAGDEAEGPRCDDGCDDGVRCTEDLCDVTGRCTHTPRDAWCDDGIACTADRCEAPGDCVHDPRDEACEDGQECTADRCDAATGCAFDAVADGSPCADGMGCTAGDACQGGTCAGVARIGAWRFGGAGDDVATSLVAFPDGGLAIAGSWNHDPGFGAYGQPWVWRLEPSGARVWEAVYAISGYAGYGGGPRLLAPTGGGFVLISQTVVDNGYDGWIAGIDADGVLLWERTFGVNDHDWATPDHEFVAGATLVPGGGYAVAGETRGDPGRYLDLWVARLADDGELLWQQGYDGVGWDTGTDLVARPEGGLVALGTTGGSITSPDDAWVLGLGDDGRVVWERQLGGPDDDWASCLELLPDGGLAVCGRRGRSAAVGDYEAWLVRLDREGDVLWERTYGGPASRSLSDVVVLADGGLAGTGHYGGDAWLVRLDAEGRVLWSRTVTETETGGTASIVAMPDGGFAVASWTESSGEWDRDAWVLRFDRWGRLDCGPDAPCDALTPADCADGDPCTTDDCAAGTGCLNESTGFSCDDGS